MRCTINIIGGTSTYIIAMLLVFSDYITSVIHATYFCFYTQLFMLLYINIFQMVF